jgi:hypothetical protein
MGFKCRPVVPLPNNRHLADSATTDVLGIELCFLRVRLFRK